MEVNSRWNSYPAYSAMPVLLWHCPRLSIRIKKLSGSLGSPAPATTGAAGTEKSTTVWQLTERYWIKVERMVRKRVTLVKQYPAVAPLSIYSRVHWDFEKACWTILLPSDCFPQSKVITWPYALRRCWLSSRESCVATHPWGHPPVGLILQAVSCGGVDAAAWNA